MRLAVALLAGSVPFVVLGLAIAYWASPKSALPVANILVHAARVRGRLWTGPADLPHTVRAISSYTPARQWGDVLWPAVTGAPWQASHWLLLGAYGIGFGALAAWGFGRDELRQLSLRHHTLRSSSSISVGVAGCGFAWLPPRCAVEAASSEALARGRRGRAAA